MSKNVVNAVKELKEKQEAEMRAAVSTGATAVFEKTTEFFEQDHGGGAKSTDQDAITVGKAIGAMNNIYDSDKENLARAFSVVMKTEVTVLDDDDDEDEVEMDAGVVGVVKDSSSCCANSGDIVLSLGEGRSYYVDKNGKNARICEDECIGINREKLEAASLPQITKLLIKLPVAVVTDVLGEDFDDAWDKLDSLNDDDELN